MRSARRLVPFTITFLLGVAGLVLPGPAGDLAGFVWLGVFPGLALARLFLPASPAGTRWTVGLALSPLVATVAGWALVHAGQPLAVAARVVGLASWIVFAGGELRALGPAAPEPADAPSDRVAWGWVIGCAAFVALPYLVNPWMRVRSDTWAHAGIVVEIAERGIPPEDPRFAGLRLNYVWFYNLFIALCDALRGASPFTSILTANVCWIGVQAAVGWQLAWALWRDRASARAAVLLLVLGFNAGALLLWPLRLVRAFVGGVTGMPEVRRIVRGAHFATVDVVHQLSAPFAHMVNSWDKFTIGTALGYAYLLLLLLLWAAARWLGAGGTLPAERGAWRWLPVAFAAVAGTMLFHSVVGLSVIPVALGACAVQVGLGRTGRIPPASGRALALAAAVAAGLAATWPYFHSIVAGWSVERAGFRFRYLDPGWQMPWTLATACGVTALAAVAGVRRAWRERNPAGLWLVAWMLGMTAFACIVRLPMSNEHKFTWQVFVALAMLGGAGLLALAAATRRRLGTPLAAAVGLALLVAPSALFLHAYLIDPAGRTAFQTYRAPGEPELYAWIRAHTPVNAVFADHRSRDVLLVEGRRRLVVGTLFGPEGAAFPSGEMAHRRAVLADLYGPVASLAGDAGCLDSLGGPAYVLYRASDFAAATPWAALDADTARFALAYADTLGHRVYRRRSP